MSLGKEYLAHYSLFNCINKIALQFKLVQNFDSICLKACAYLNYWNYVIDKKVDWLSNYLRFQVQESLSSWNLLLSCAKDLLSLLGWEAQVLDWQSQQ